MKVGGGGTIIVKISNWQITKFLKIVFKPIKIIKLFSDSIANIYIFYNKNIT